VGSFSSYVELLEAKREQGVPPKLAVFAFMRANPPTQGHRLIVDTVERIANQRKGDPFIFLSHSEDPANNPLPYKEKLEFMRRVCPQGNFVDGTEQLIKNPFQASGYLGSFLKYTDIILVCGSDRVNEYQSRFKDPLKYFDTFEVVSAGERDPDQEGIAGMSGTRARIAAAQDNEVGFQDATGWTDEASEWLFRAVRKGMKNNG